MNHKRIIFGVIVIIIVVAMVLFITYKQRINQILGLKETQLQQQVQEIFKKGTDSDCSVISDPRYEFLCHDYFIAKSLPLPVVPIALEINMNVQYNGSPKIFTGQEAVDLLKVLPQRIQNEILQKTK